jgi:hypothetical protein
MSEERPPSSPEDHLREVRDALRLMLDEQIHTLDQLLQRSAVLLGAASVLAGLLAASTIGSSAPAWRQWTTAFAFATLLASLGTGIIAVWPLSGAPQLPPDTDTDRGITGRMGHYVIMDPKDFLRKQCDGVYAILNSDKYAKMIRRRGRLFRVEAIALVIGGVLVAINSLAVTLDAGSASGTPHKVAPTQSMQLIQGARPGGAYIALSSGPSMPTLGLSRRECSCDMPKNDDETK